MSAYVFVQDPDFTLVHANVIDGLRTLPDESIHCVVTSPPYWGLRDYGTAEWEGGDPEHEHVGSVTRTTPPGSELQANNKGADHVRSGDCACGAKRIDQQLGLEPTPEQFVENLRQVFAEVRRVLRKDGTLWLNLGDSYSQGGYAGDDAPANAARSEGGSGTYGSFKWTPRVHDRQGGEARKRKASDIGLKPKDLVGIPWMVAFALRADGWYLRSDIIWSKPNPMPESVTDRPTKAHEYLFMLSKSPRYFWDQEAVKETSIGVWNSHDAFVKSGPRPKMPDDPRLKDLQRTQFSHDTHHPDVMQTTRNVRSVWEISPQPYSEAHFATYPEALVARCVKAGTSEHGCCPECGAPWQRIVEREYGEDNASEWAQIAANGAQTGGVGKNFRDVAVRDLGWTPGCDCGRDDVVPCVVLDTFLGSGTTAHVARKLGRRSVGIELNGEYCKMAARRLQQQSLFAIPS